MSFSMYVIMLLAIALPTAAEPPQDDDQVVLIANYHATLRAGVEYRQMQGQAKVRDTHQFPIQFDDFRILVLLIRTSENDYEADVVIERLAGTEWSTINTDELSFSANFSSPTELKWSHNEYSFDLAIAVSVMGE